MDLPFVFTVRRSSRARRLRIQVGPGGIAVIVPATLPESSVYPFLREHQDWVLRKQQEFALRTASGRQREAIMPLVSGSLIPFGDESLVLRVEQGSGQRVTVRRQSDELHIRLGSAVSEAQAEPLLRHGLYRWVSTALEPRLQAMILQHAVRAQLEPRYLRIKRMRTRWGSCGPMNDINLNWLLAFCPLSVLEYVLVHELCHIRHRNHSAGFWALVGEHLPDWQAQRHWLKQHGPALIQRFEYN
ncbi:MAG: hypothetical protein RIQ52_1272 [Pseudomonadota bacterium]